MILTCEVEHLRPSSTIWITGKTHHSQNIHVSELPVVFRRASSEDAPVLTELMHSAIRGDASAEYSEAELQDWLTRLSEEGVRVKIETSALFEVGELDGEVVALGALGVTPDEIDLVYVSPNHARKGIGSIILRRLEAVSRQKGVSLLWLDASRNAVPMYAKHGYAKSCNSGPKPGRECLCTRMEKPLS
ncbi:GNAT family N-acetyltransferase [Kamptonema cortianum]|nr:GNAT family N-acetyltransferase [Kamptonema cortianum]